MSLDGDLDGELADVQGESGGQPAFGVRFHSLSMRNFLSYQEATLHFDEFIAIVGPNGAGKSNALAAIKLLREIPTHGLPNALRRRGGYDQLRHRSQGRPYDPALRLEFSLDGSDRSHYEISFSAVKGKRYKVKRESCRIKLKGGGSWSFESDGRFVTVGDSTTPSDDSTPGSKIPVAPGQSALSTGNLAAFVLQRVLGSMQAVEINPSRIGDLQDPSSTRDFEPDGSNAASVYESMSAGSRVHLVTELSAIVPGIARIEPRSVADKQTLAFFQTSRDKNREFFAKQMSDGTLRSFGILLALHQPNRPALVVIEEPEVAIHLGAMTTLVELLRAWGSDSQIVITTHSADVINALPVEALRVVWSEDGASHMSEVSQHTRRIVSEGLMTPGQLLRADALDPAG